MEVWDLFDENRKPLNRRQSRLAPKVQGEYHLVVVVCVVNSKHEILLTLRDPRKEKYPNLWENTGGCIQAGETSRAGAVRELFEETGIRAEESELCFLETQKEEYSFIDFYVLRRDVELSDIVLQDGETVDAKWVTLEELHRMGQEGMIAGPIYRRIKSLGKKFEAAFARPEKIIIIGASGSGKSTVARQLSSMWNIPVVHLDKLSWKAGWVRASNEEFDRLVEKELEKDKWIMDGNFPRTLKRRMDACDMVIYLDYPLWFCIFRVLWRVVRNYGKPRQDMTLGCPEKFDPGFLKRIWNFNRERRDMYYCYLAELRDTEIIILRNQKECNRYLETVCSEVK